MKREWKVVHEMDDENGSPHVGLCKLTIDLENLYGLL